MACVSSGAQLPHWIMLVVIVVGYLSIELHVREIEEPYLESLHGQIFVEYKDTTGRYIPTMKKRQ